MHEYSISDSIHFFSFGTGISIELPVDWKQKGETNGTAAYVYNVDEGEASSFKKAPVLVVKRIDVPAGNADAYRKLEKELIEIPRRDMIIISQSSREIDSYVGSVSVMSYFDLDIDGTVVHHQSFFQVESVIYSISGIVEEEHREDFLTVFGNVLNSVRVIPI